MMPSQRRPPPPPPPDDDSPPPLPKRTGPDAPSNPQPTSDDAPPPLPGRPLPNGLGADSQQRPASPKDEYLLPSEAPQLPPRCKTPEIEDEYLLPDQAAEPQEAYEEIGNVDLTVRYADVSKPKSPSPSSADKKNTNKKNTSVRPWNSFRDLLSRPKEVQSDDKQRKTSVPAKFTQEKFDEVEHEEEDTYLNPDADPDPLPSQRKNDGGASSCDEDDWGSDFDDDAPQIPRGFDGAGGSNADMYLTPAEGGENSEASTSDNTYEPPDCVQKPVIPKPTPPNPAKSKPNTLPRDPSQPVSVMERMKMFQQRSETKERSHPPPSKSAVKSTPKSSPISSTRPNISPKPSTLNSGKLPTAIVQPYVPPAAPVPSLVNASSNPRPPHRNNPPTLPPKPNDNSPPALPPNHPTRDSDSGSAGSISSGSGGVVKNDFIAGLNKVIAGKVVGKSIPSPRNVPQFQDTVGNAKEQVDQLYADGTSGDMEPLATYPWFHSDVTKENKLGDERVTRVGVDGAFLVRKSSKKDTYVLVVYHGGKVFSLPVNLREDGKYAIGEEKVDEKRFVSVPDFIEHHQKYNINLSKGGTVTLSKHASKPR